MKNAAVWFDIPSSDFDRAVKFYSEILDSPIKVTDFMGQKMGMFPMDQDGDVGGALMPPDTGLVPSKNGSRVYLSVENLDAILPKVEPAGGKILKSKFPVGQDNGFIAIIEDSEGNTVGLHSPK